MKNVDRGTPNPTILESLKSYSDGYISSWKVWEQDCKANYN